MVGKVAFVTEKGFIKIFLLSTNMTATFFTFASGIITTLITIPVFINSLKQNNKKKLYFYWVNHKNYIVLVIVKILCIDAEIKSSPLRKLIFIHIIHFVKWKVE